MASIQVKINGKEEQLLGSVATYIFTLQASSTTENGQFQFTTTDPDLFNFFTVGTIYTVDFTAV